MEQAKSFLPYDSSDLRGKSVAMGFSIKTFSLRCRYDYKEIKHIYALV